MIKDLQTSPQRINYFLESDLFSISTDNIIESTDQEKRNLENRIVHNKNAEKFSSLERIRIIVDGLIGDISEKELCERENISRKVYLAWKDDFLVAFNAYSEMEILQKAITSKNRELIESEIGQEAFDYYNSFFNVSSGDNLVISKGKFLSNYSNFNKVTNVIFLDKVNNFRLINKQLEEVNTKIPNGGILMGNFETFNDRAERIRIYHTPFKNIYFGFEFVFKRVMPKLPYLKKAYFFVTKGKNRLLSKAEALGRLVSCGFDIVDVKKIDGVHYFVAKKVKEPTFDMSPSYGPLFKMRRVGKNGKIIKVYKFRTMHPYSEYLQDYVLKINGYAETGKPANDFRLVPWGKFLRRYWLDELPQLINLVKGDLKLVGCRPVSQRYFQDIPKDVQELRLTQKPGCIPPYVALNRSGSIDSVLNAEKEYLKEKIKNPYFTDTKYFMKAIFNIVFKHKRSA